MINDCPSAAGSPTQSLRSSPQLRRPSRGEYAFLPTSMPAIPTTSNTAAFIAMTFNHLEMADDFRMIFPVLTTLPIFTSLETFEILSSHGMTNRGERVSTLSPSLMSRVTGDERRTTTTSSLWPSSHCRLFSASQVSTTTSNRKNSQIATPRTSAKIRKSWFLDD